MPIMTHYFDEFPGHMESDLMAIYAIETFFQEPGQVCPLTSIKQKMRDNNSRLYAAHFGGRWLSSAIVTGGVETRQIEHLCVHASARLRGIGKKLVNEIRRLESLAGNEKLITIVSSNDQVAQSFLTAVDANQSPSKNTRSHQAKMIPFNTSPQASLCFNLMG